MAVVRVDREKVVKEPHRVLQCDECGKQDEFDEDSSSLPEGWIQLVRATRDFIAEQRGGVHDFCSWSCCRAFAKLQVDPKVT